MSSKDRQEIRSCRNEVLILLFDIIVRFYAVLIDQKFTVKLERQYAYTLGHAGGSLRGRS